MSEVLWYLVVLKLSARMTEPRRPVDGRVQGIQDLESRREYQIQKLRFDVAVELGAGQLKALVVSQVFKRECCVLAAAVRPNGC